MVLVSLRNPESGPFLSELGCTPSPTHHQNSPAKVGTQCPAVPSPTGWEKGEVVGAALPLPIPTAVSRMLTHWGKHHLAIWLQWPAPGASRNPQTRQ